jgi:hypothetical protein
MISLDYRILQNIIECHLDSQNILCIFITLKEILFIECKFWLNLQSIFKLENWFLKHSWSKNDRKISAITL